MDRRRVQVARHSVRLVRTQRVQHRHFDRGLSVVIDGRVWGCARETVRRVHGRGGILVVVVAQIFLGTGHGRSVRRRYNERLRGRCVVAEHGQNGVGTGHFQAVPAVVLSKVGQG